MDSHTSDNPTIPNSIPLQGLRVPTSASRPVVNGFLEHPIRSLSPGQVAEEVDAFVNLNNLDDLRDLLHQAGQVARSPYAPQNIGELEPADVAALRNENVRPFHHPSKLWICLATCSTAAALQGWSQVGFLPKADEIWLGLDPNSFQLGAVASSPYFVAALCGCWLSAPLNERFGRRSPLLAAAVVNLLAAFGAACSQHWWQVLICRSLTGVSMGLKASVAPILAAEVAPPSIRGSVVMGAWQICVAGGILLGYSTALIFKDKGSAWRYEIGSPFVLSIPLIVLYPFCVESPRWQIKKGRFREAYNTLICIRNRPIQAARDLYTIAAQVQVERRLLLEMGEAQSTSFTKFKQLFSRRRNRSATAAASIIMLGQQLCGINVIIFFGLTLFESKNDSLWVMWGIGLLNMLAGLPGLYLSDIIGRRRLLLWFYPTNCLFMLAGGLSYMISELRTGAIAVFMFLFVASYSPAQGPVAFLYASEAFPVTHREIGMSWSVALNLFWAGVLAILYPEMDRSLNKENNHVYRPNYVLITFAALNLVAMTLVYLFCRETMLYTLEELDQVFAVSIRTFASRRLHYLHNVFQHYVLRKTDVISDSESDI